MIKMMIICLAREGLLHVSAPKGIYRESKVEDYGL